MPERLSYEDSYRSLQAQRWKGAGPVPPLLEKSPAYADEVLGVEFFRTLVDGNEGADFRNLTLPRTFFGRSEISHLSFAGSNLSESVANWNDFIDVDFTGADLTRLDLRACLVEGVNFSNCRLVEADLRLCSFVNCKFDGADLTGAKLTRDAGRHLNLTEEQRSVVNWQDEDGEEPDGG
jgi:BTB/POZ domain-containing protein KCTD9